ncbi:ABC transporter ATP-binding protein [Romboutsia sp. CE17]|uniref:ABC transporter ATP-binding protein n=1 Tax=Romboutsia sp. CE17 TaxID=2724150 RepID=UPI001442E44C|nr:ABC transporter ATP-binding protein [Romboutsia sp. CE17]QJA08202.1 ABC transporter ATP-binding protein [Romboutsia sp. CE17]
MIKAENLKVGYEEKIIIEDLSIHIEKGQIVSVLGPNGCGKSTLLKTLSRMIKPKHGDIYLNDKNLSSLKNKYISQKLCLLSQHNNAPNDISVEQLVYFGRMPHKKWYETKNKEDQEIVDWAIENVGLTKYKNRSISYLSGGERQRAYLAQALCQKSEILFLDEPTTYLDISHQLELMELVRDINKKFGITIVMVLHDLNQASKYSDRLVIMKNGNIVADGNPQDIINHEMIKNVYRVECDIDNDPISNRPRVHPIQTIRCKENDLIGA